MKNHFPNRLWKQALILALLFHLAVVGGFVFGPTLFNEKKQTQIPYTVRLFEPQRLVNHSAQKAQKVLEKPSSEKKSVSSIKKEQPPPRPQKNIEKPRPKVAKQKPKAKKKAVSLNPKKSKKVKKAAKKKETKKKVAKSNNRTRLKEEKVAEKIKEIQNRLKEKREEEYLKKRLSELARKAKGQGASGKVGAGSTQNQQAMIYGNFVKAKIWRNWHFPKALANRKDLEAVVTIIITKNGRILDMRVKKYSGFSAFDRSVIKAIKDSAPLPPLPPSLGQGPEEIDIRFDLSKVENSA